MSDDEGCAHVMSWISRLNPSIVFGPAPRGTDDVAYLSETLDVTLFINLTPRSATYTRVPEFVSKRSMKRTVATSEAYIGYFDDDNPLPVEYHNVPFDSAAIPPKGRLKEHQICNLAVEYVRFTKREVMPFIKGKAITFIHAKDGFGDEAFIAFAVWALSKAHSPPSDVLAWFTQAVGSNSPVVNKGVLNEDEENLKLLAAIWAEARKPASPFDRGAK